MVETVLKLYAFNLSYARRLVLDVPEGWMARPAGPGLENHPAFTLGHLAMGSARTAAALGLALDVPDGFEALFDRNGPGDPRTPVEDGPWPSQEILLAELSRQHDRVDGALRTLDPDRLTEATAWRFEKALPTLGDVVAFMCVEHEAMHLGQLAAWRRAMGLDSALGAM